jgi:nucleotidyltransferase/DNA polymerase involved in DNA repair
MTPEECVHRIRDNVMKETKLTVSAGIAPNKVCCVLFANVSNCHQNVLDVSEGDSPHRHRLVLPDEIFEC